VLRELRIENLLLIERAELRFGPGLNAITGETGAGKTMLAHSIDLLLGGKPNPQIVRPGAGEIWVEAEFEAPDGFWDDPELADQAERFADSAGEGIVLARRVPADGRSRAFVCHRSATSADLAALGSRLLSFFGQFEHRRLALSAVQAGVLDRFAGVKHLELLDAYVSVHEEVLGLERRLAQIDAADASRERDADLLLFEVDEIRAIGPTVEERQSLALERDRLRNATALTEAAGEAWAALGEGDGSGGDPLRLAAGRVADAARLDGSLADLSRRLDDIVERAGEAASEIRAYLEAITADSGESERIEERLDAIERLERKHGGSTEAVLAYADECERRLAAMERAEEGRADVLAALEAAGERRTRAAGALTASRKKAAEKLEATIAGELEGLALEGATLEVHLEPNPGGFGRAGAEHVELRFSANPGIEPAPLREAASGGELSRVMLALATAAGGREQRTIVFDEIDSGVGGRVAARVGERLATLAAERQVICITHLAQVASRSDRHFTVEKAVKGGQAQTTARSIEGEQLVGELVRMLGAPADDEAATQHARDLLAA
jgi:DNA repair protein RecN (Recombination protein N)